VVRSTAAGDAGLDHLFDSSVASRATIVRPTAAVPRPVDFLESAEHRAHPIESGPDHDRCQFAAFASVCPRFPGASRRGAIIQPVEPDTAHTYKRLIL
jgi:hypothetical protein